MNVAESMQANFGLFHNSEQVATADRPAQECPVALSPRRPVGYQDIGVGRNKFPLGLKCRSAREIKGHISKGRLPGAAIELDPLDGNDLILQVNAIRQTSFTGLGLSFEAGIMVAGDDEFVGVG